METDYQEQDNRKTLDALNWGILLLLIPFSGTQQTLTTFFSNGYAVIVAIYLAGTLSTIFLAPLVMTRFGLKYSTILGATGYAMLPFIGCFGNTGVMTGGIILGIAAGFFWPSLSAQLAQATSDKIAGRDNGRFFLFYSFGLGIGCGLLPFLSSVSNYQFSYGLFAIFSLVALVPFSLTKTHNNPYPKNSRVPHQQINFRSLTNQKVLPYYLVAFCCYLIYGIVISLIPAQMTILLGNRWLGLGGGSFFLISGVTIAYSGHIIDRFGIGKVIAAGYLFGFVALVCLLAAKLTTNQLLFILALFLLIISYAFLQPAFGTLQKLISTKETLGTVTTNFMIYKNLAIITPSLLGLVLSGQAIFASMVIYGIATLAILGSSLALLKYFSMLQANIIQIKEMVNIELAK